MNNEDNHLIFPLGISSSCSDPDYEFENTNDDHFLFNAYSLGSSELN